MKTMMAKKEDVKHRWHVVNAEGKILGRVASRVAAVLRGKYNVDFTPHIDGGDYVVVINADKIRVTGKKLEQKFYKSYSGYPGGLKEEALKTLLKRKPAEALRLAIWGMIPKGRLGRKIFKKLKIYSGATNPHVAQKCKELAL